MNDLIKIDIDNLILRFYNYICYIIFFPIEKATGIPAEFKWNSTRVSHTFQWNFHGFHIDSTLEFHWDSTEFPVRFQWNFTGNIQGDSTIILVELQCVFREKLNLGLKDGWIEELLDWNSTGFALEVWRTRYSNVIPLVFLFSMECDDFPLKFHWVFFIARVYF